MSGRRRLGGAEVGAIVVALPALAVFWLTAFPTITWWDSSSYSLAAATLGINSPPGSLLLTLIGWPVAHLPFGDSPAYLLNLFAGLLAALVVALVYVASTTALRAAGAETRGHAAIGVAAGALTFAFSGTLWSYAIRFTPYVLSAVFTGLILWTLLRWWTDADSPNAWRWLGVLGVLFGLDFSVHRTNALLIPGAIIWVLIRRPSTLRARRSILAAAGGMTAGLAVHLLLIPMALFTRSSLNFSDPSSLSRFWDYVTLKQLGGSFLLQLFPRRSSIWSVQTADLLQVLGGNFLHWTGPARALGVLPAVAAAWGIVSLWRGNRRLAAAFAIVLMLQAALTVLYFNIPAGFFRTFDRHYLPVCVTIGVLIACGLGAVARQVWVNLGTYGSLAVVTTALAVLPAAQLWTNWSANDASRRYFTRDYAANALLGLPPNAIYFTVGDNDTFPVLYLQSAEGVRRDVTIINLSVANILTWPEQLTKRDPSFPLSLSANARQALMARPWTDTVMVLPVRGTPQELGLSAGARAPDSITLSVRPAQGTFMLPAEIVLLDILRTNAWRRPLAFSVTDGRAIEWLEPYGRMDGLFYRVVPALHAPADPGTLRTHMLDTARYRGYADATIPIDDVSRTMGLLSYAPLLTLLSADASAGAPDACQADRKALLARLPLERLTAPDGYRDQIASACAGKH